MDPETTGDFQDKRMTKSERIFNFNLILSIFKVGCSVKNVWNIMKTAESTTA